ncbi:hypothetical protein PGT21_011919 [Puccinia graminis f. sp. tritici]|uniref:Uncharacterized protein n=1 Tax=Puccinia graminis f. sp. tritici TaxID=56615 RepID=A0A5B0N5B7_PUCGR|nr:hypothetical protein PGT21_011919 [Puccinia graminis f. sp. tritici]
MDKSPHYKMREIQRTSKSLFVESLVIKSGLNAQHNCQHGACELTETDTDTIPVERRKSTRKALVLKHNNINHYIINVASLSSAALHRRISDLESQLIQPLEWVDTMHNGIRKWSMVAKKKENAQARKRKKIVASTSIVDPDLV